MAGEAAVSDSISPAWAASPASIAVAVVYKRDPRLSATPWGCSSAAALPSRSLAIRLRDGAARLFT
jgi:hypothetical protein